MFLTIVKWISLPVLVAGSVISAYAGNYEFLLNLLVCACALGMVQRRVASREYFWAAGFAGIAVLYGPMALLLKLFLLLSLTCAGALAGMYVAWKPARVAAV